MDVAGAQLFSHTANDVEPDGEVLPDELSSGDIASVDDLAELVLTTSSARRRLIAFGRLSGCSPEDHPTVLAGRLLERYGTEPAVRKMLDAAPQAEVVSRLSRVHWVGDEGSYLLVPQGEDVGALRSAVLCLTGLVTAHLERGKKGVDNFAHSTPLLKKQPSLQTTVNTNSISPEIPKHILALIEQAALSRPGDAFVLIGDDLLTVPERAAKALRFQWSGWLQVALDNDFDVEQAVALTPCLPQGIVHLIVGYLKNSTPIRSLDEFDAPSLRSVAQFLAGVDSEVSHRAAERLRVVFYEEHFTNAEEFLTECLATLLESTETA